MSRPAGTRGELSPRMLAQRRRRLRHAPLLTVVREFLAFGVPCDTGGRVVSCFYCGQELAHGHAEACLWARLRDRVAEEGSA